MRLNTFELYKTTAIIEAQNKNVNNINGTKSKYDLGAGLRQAIKTAVQNKIIPKIRIHMYANN